MVMIAIALMIVAAFALVAYPLFKSATEVDPVVANFADPVWENLVVQRDAAYLAIKDVESDHAMGKLSDADYKSLRAKYEAKAVAVLQELDSLGASQKKNARRADSDDAIEYQVQQLRRAAAEGAPCPRCGTRAKASDRFCAKCGMRLGK